MLLLYSSTTAASSQPMVYQTLVNVAIIIHNICIYSTTTGNAQSCDTIPAARSYSKQCTVQDVVVYLHDGVCRFEIYKVRADGTKRPKRMAVAGCRWVDGFGQNNGNIYDIPLYRTHTCRSGPAE